MCLSLGELTPNKTSRERERELTSMGIEMEYGDWELQELFDQVDSYGTIETPDGCTVEPDGICPHGQESPLLTLGMI